jgi:hypothetical protein
VRELRSPFTVERPPPASTPPGVPVVIGWQLAASVWRSHLPDPLTREPICTACRLPMPCPCWRFADAFRADVLRALQPSGRTPIADDATRELPRVKPQPLPRRQPGAQLEAETRYDGWFTPPG